MELGIVCSAQPRLLGLCTYSDGSFPEFSGSKDEVPLHSVTLFRSEDLEPATKDLTLYLR
jgi:hypothetical protein